MSRNTSRSSITRRALKSVRGNVPGGDDLDLRAQAEHLLQLARGLVAQRRDARSPPCAIVLGVDLDADHELVHRALAGDDDPVLAAVAGQLVQHRIDLARIDVLAADREHVVDAPEDALRQARIGAPARRRAVLPQRQVAGGEPDHRLRRALEMRVHRRAALAVRHAPDTSAGRRLRCRRCPASSSMPSVSARAGDVHERRHLGHRAAIDRRARRKRRRSGRARPAPTRRARRRRTSSSSRSCADRSLPRARLRRDAARTTASP